MYDKDLLEEGNIASSTRPQRSGSFRLLAFAFGTLCALITLLQRYLPASEQVALVASDVRSKPICDKIMIFSLSGNAGFGSNVLILTRAATYARARNYTFLVTDNGTWVYGKWQDYFETPRSVCTLPEDAFDLSHPDLVEFWSPERASAKRILAHREMMNAIDDALYEELGLIDAGDASLLDTIGHDIYTPLPVYESIPLPYMRAFLALHESLKYIWLPNQQLQASIAAVQEQMREERTKSGQPNIAIHFRGGDKIGTECLQNCGNTTIYLMAARDYLERHRLPRATINLMTVEPDALSAFQGNELAAQFDIRLAPGTHRLESHSEAAFEAASLEDRQETTRDFLRDITSLVSASDVFFVTATSNAGALAMLLGGLDRSVFSLDQTFRPLVSYSSWTRHVPAVDGL